MFGSRRSVVRVRDVEHRRLRAVVAGVGERGAVIERRGRRHARAQQPARAAEQIDRGPVRGIDERGRVVRERAEHRLADVDVVVERRAVAVERAAVGVAHRGIAGDRNGRHGERRAASRRRTGPVASTSASPSASRSTNGAASERDLRDAAAIAAHEQRGAASEMSARSVSNRSRRARSARTSIGGGPHRRRRASRSIAATSAFHSGSAAPPGAIAGSIVSSTPSMPCAVTSARVGPIAVAGGRYPWWPPSRANAAIASESPPARTASRRATRSTRPSCRRHTARARRRTSGTSGALSVWSGGTIASIAAISRARSATSATSVAGASGAAGPPAHVSRQRSPRTSLGSASYARRLHASVTTRSPNVPGAGARSVENDGAHPAIHATPRARYFFTRPTLNQRNREKNDLTVLSRSDARRHTRISPPTPGAPTTRQVRAVRSAIALRAMRRTSRAYLSRS